MGKINLGKKTLGRSESFKNMKEVERGKMRKTIQNIKGTPVELQKVEDINNFLNSEDINNFLNSSEGTRTFEANNNTAYLERIKNILKDKRLAADKKRAASKTVKVSKPERKPKRNPEASSKDYTGDIKEFLRIKKSKGGKVSSRGRGMGKALRGGGKVMI